MKALEIVCLRGWKLAQPGKVEVEACPDLDSGTKALLGGATGRLSGLSRSAWASGSVAVGEEFVLFRHEKTFYHPPGIMGAGLRHLAGGAGAAPSVETVRERVVHRVGWTSS